MTNDYILARVSHGNEPIFISMSIASHFPDDIVLPVPKSKVGLLKEIVDGKGIDKRRVYIDEGAFNISSAYGVFWGGNMDYGQWVANNAKHFDGVNSELSGHYRSFKATNLYGDEKEFKGKNARMILSAGDLYDNFGLDTPVVYVFPHRYGEILSRSAQYASFGQFLRNRELKRSVNFIPFVHSLEYDRNYVPLSNEEFTPHMKEPPARSDIAIPHNSIGMVFSGTGKKIEELKQIAARTSHRIVTGLFSPVDGEKYVKIVPPRAEFVHVYADPRIRAVVGQIGYGMLWGAWNAEKPVVFPAWVDGDDEEFIHNAKTIKRRGLGVEIKTPEQIDGAVERAQACMPAIAAMNAGLLKEFGTLDGPAYIAKRIRELGLY